MTSKLMDNITTKATSSKFLSPPSFQLSAIKTLWEEEIFRESNKPIRISLSNLEGNLSIGLGSWYFNVQNQALNPSKGQICIPLLAWRAMQYLEETIEMEIKRAEMRGNQFDQCMYFSAYIYGLLIIFMPILFLVDVI